jgi:hypothetical protein
MIGFRFLLRLFLFCCVSCCLHPSARVGLSQQEQALAVSIMDANHLQRETKAEDVLAAYALVNKKDRDFATMVAKNKSLSEHVKRAESNNEIVRLARRISYAPSSRTSHKLLLWDVDPATKTSIDSKIPVGEKTHQSGFCLLEHVVSGNPGVIDDQEFERAIEECAAHAVYESHHVLSIHEELVVKDKSLFYILDAFEAQAKVDFLKQVMRQALSNTVTTERDEAVTRNFIFFTKVRRAFPDADDLLGHAVYKFEALPPFTMICRSFEVPMVTDTIAVPVSIEKPKDGADGLLRLKFNTIFPCRAPLTPVILPKMSFCRPASVALLPRLLMYRIGPEGGLKQRLTTISMGAPCTLDTCPEDIVVDGLLRFHRSFLCTKRRYRESQLSQILDEQRSKLDQVQTASIVGAESTEDEVLGALGLLDGFLSNAQGLVARSRDDILQPFERISEELQFFTEIDQAAGRAREGDIQLVVSKLDKFKSKQGVNEFTAKFSDFESRLAGLPQIKEDLEKRLTRIRKAEADESKRSKLAQVQKEYADVKEKLDQITSFEAEYQRILAISQFASDDNIDAMLQEVESQRAAITDLIGRIPTVQPLLGPLKPKKIIAIVNEVNDLTKQMYDRDSIDSDAIKEQVEALRKMKDTGLPEYKTRLEREQEQITELIQYITVYRKGLHQFEENIVPLQRDMDNLVSRCSGDLQTARQIVGLEEISLANKQSCQNISNEHFGLLALDPADIVKQAALRYDTVQKQYAAVVSSIKQPRYQQFISQLQPPPDKLLPALTEVEQQIANKRKELKDIIDQLIPPLSGSDDDLLDFCKWPI